MEGAYSGMQSISLAKLLLFQNMLPSKISIRKDIFPLVHGLVKLEMGEQLRLGMRGWEGGMRGGRVALILLLLSCLEERGRTQRRI